MIDQQLYIIKRVYDDCENYQTCDELGRVAV